MSRSCGEILEYMNQTWPEAYALDWDNVGLLAGTRKKQVERVYVALDATEEVIADAKAAGAELLITHHPLIFGSLKRVNDEASTAARVMDLLVSGISCYSTHTSFDIAPGGMADGAAEKSGIFALDAEGKPVCEPLEVTGTDLSGSGETVGVGKAGALKAPMTIRELAIEIKKAFGLPAVLLYAEDPEKLVKTAAISPGSGKGMAREAESKGAEVLITGDMGHHDGLDLVSDHMALIDAGHYGLEHIFIQIVAEKLGQEFPELCITKAPIRWPYEVL